MLNKGGRVNKARILKMFGAQTYGTLINTLDRLATVPLFIYFWGVDLFGEWLILRAIPSYLAVAELGFATAASNRMSVLILNEKYKQALGYFQSVFLVLCFVSVLLIALVFWLFYYVDVKQLFNFSSTSGSYNLMSVAMLLLGYSLLIFQTQLLSAAYRSVGRYVTAAYITYNIRVVELLALVAVILFDGGLLGVSASYFLVRLLGAAFMAVSLLRDERWLKYGVSEARLSIVKEMTPDASGFLAFPLGQAMSLQGTIFIIAHFLSPAAVALFSISRTLSRTIVQLGMQVNRSIWPELTRL